MLKCTECNEFVGTCVDIGTKNYAFPDRFFYYTGILVEATEEFIKIKTRTGYKLIPLIEIFEIRLSKEGMRI